MIYPAREIPSEIEAEAESYVSFSVTDQWLGIPVERVQEVLAAQRISPVPLAPEEIAGFLNLRGQIVTAIDLRARLSLPARSGDSASMNVVVRDREELFSLLVDAVGDVVDAPVGALEPIPRVLDAHWRRVCDGVVRLPVGLLVVLNVDRLLAASLAE